MYCVCNSNLSVHSAWPKVYKFFFWQYQKFEWVAMMSYQSGQRMYYSTLLLLQSIFFCLLTEWSLCPAVEKFNSRSLWYRARQYWFFTPQSYTIDYVIINVNMMSFSLWHHQLYFTEDIIMLLWHHLLWFIEDIIMYFDSVKVIQWNHNDLLILIYSYQYIWTLWNFKLCVHLYTGNDINNSWVIIMRAFTDMYLIRTKFMFVYFLAKLLILIDNV